MDLNKLKALQRLQSKTKAIPTDEQYASYDPQEEQLESPYVNPLDLATPGKVAANAATSALGGNLKDFAIQEKKKELVGPPVPLPYMEREQKIKEMLENIKMLESSGGKNVNHKTLRRGLHAGDSAVGSYALMPKTTDEIINRAYQQGDADIDIQRLKELDKKARRQYILNNPSVEEKLAKRLAEHVLEKNEDNDEAAAHAWLYGHNKKYEPEELENSERVAKYRELKQKMLRNK